MPDEIERTYWNYEPTTARKVVIRVPLASDSPRPHAWYAPFEGQERPAVVVDYEGLTYVLDDEDDLGWRKVTTGRGGPEYGHRQYPDDVEVLRER